MPIEKSHAPGELERTAFGDAVERAASSIVNRCGAEGPEIASWLSNIMRSLGVDDQAEGWALIADPAARQVASGSGAISPALNMRVSPDRARSNDAGGAQSVKAPNGRFEQATRR